MSVLNTTSDVSPVRHPCLTAGRSRISYHRSVRAPEPEEIYQQVPGQTRHSQKVDSPFSDGFVDAARSTGRNSAKPAASSGKAERKFNLTVSTEPDDKHRLRRKISPTHKSLRELCAEQQSWQSHLHAMQSDEHLRVVYESQILFYLEGQFADIDNIVE
jgi:hypothetical protein